MKKLSNYTFALLTCLFVGWSGVGQAQTELKALAREMLLELQKGEAELYARYASDELLKAVPADQVAGIWNQLESQLGKAAPELVDPIENKLGENIQIIQPIKFGVMSLAFISVFSKENKLTGIAFQPFQAQTSPSDSEKKAPYDYPEKYEEEDISFASGTFTISGTLTTPKQANTNTLVVFVSGSGPNDRHSTVGPNKPHQDMARGLAGLGISTLRFDKRTFSAARQIQEEGLDITIDVEVVDDAVAAIEFAQKTGKYTKIIVLGHSLGGMFAPRIASKSQVSGIIIMAGNSRPLEVLIVEQFEKLLDGNPSKDRVLDELKGKVANLDRLASGDKLADDELPLGQPAAYWKSLRAYDQVATAQSLSVPILLLQAEEDYQVTMDDFHGWKQALPQATTISYPNLDHLMRPSNGKIGMEAYADQVFVSEQVIQDIANWIIKIK
ncbi:alpha/beta hydrolase [Mongoliitalea daihaiensis]|uniref:alpha/beta hydrolase n=1 Tax=Mongoliitalea daihaiensis TaxID=2782006 RepID=UPI001F244F5A|nr:alpha/beta fold hydrolase [Mongoliitalea daihaiensis]UJP65338.1 alpha/beta fold hydrolase [Mongoliitalea daihaiensis]